MVLLVTGRLSEENYSDARHFKAVGLMSLLGGATGINYYMFFEALIWPDGEPEE